jgi:hypothetical protein
LFINELDPALPLGLIFLPCLSLRDGAKLKCHRKEVIFGEEVVYFVMVVGFWESLGDLTGFHRKGG